MYIAWFVYLCTRWGTLGLLPSLGFWEQCCYGRECWDIRRGEWMLAGPGTSVRTPTPTWVSWDLWMFYLFIFMLRIGHGAGLNGKLFLESWACSGSSDLRNCSFPFRVSVWTVRLWTIQRAQRSRGCQELLAKLGWVPIATGGSSCVRWGSSLPFQYWTWTWLPHHCGRSRLWRGGPAHPDGGSRPQTTPWLTCVSFPASGLVGLGLKWLAIPVHKLWNFLFFAQSTEFSVNSHHGLVFHFYNSSF